MAALKFTLVALICMMVAVPVAQAITCQQVTKAITPCFAYVLKGGKVPAACCGGIRSLNSMAKSTPDRQQTCRCLKNSAGVIKGGTAAGNAASLPGKCGVKIPFKISLATDCNKVR